MKLDEIPRCRDCKWRTGRMSSIGIECMQPDNQEKWNEKEKIRTEAKVFYPHVVARYKTKSHRACKRFERREP